MLAKSKIEGRLALVAGVLVLVGIGWTRLYGYLLFHSISELLCVVISVCIFIIAWHSRDIAEAPYFLFLGIGGLAASGLDLVHTLAFKGMGVFSGATANLPTQYWVAARYVESAVFLAAPLFIGRRPRPSVLLLGAIAAFALLVSLIWTGVFPDCYVEGSGLTVFKKTSEYVIAALFAGGVVFLLARRKAFDSWVLSLLVAGLAVKILSEIAFTLYVGVYDTFNLLGHLLRIVAAALIYRGVVRTGFEKPYRLLFRQMKQREEELSRALSEVRTLSGMLPICMNCKKIRDDAGYWQQIEAYISEHSKAQFTHGICPQCAKLLFPEETEAVPEENRGRF
jgi:hypothetical protein